MKTLYIKKYSSLLNITLGKQKLSLLPQPINGSSFNNYLLRCTLVAWLVAKAISYKLWMADRLFPLVSPFNFPFPLPIWVHTFLFVGGVMIMLILFVLPHKRNLICLLIAIELLSCTLDQMRWQPWEYQYIITLLIFLINKRKPKRVVYMMQLILAATYFYSGIQKLNPAFVPVFWEGMVLKNLLKVQPQVLKLPAILLTGHSIPWIETLGGLLLLFNKTNRFGAILMIATHVLILLIIGPQALNYNKVIWIWNVVMIFYLYLLFIHNKESKKGLSLLLLPSINLPVIILWTVMPAFNFINMWPNYLSFSLYSCKSKEMIICINNYKATINELNQHFEKDDSRYSIDDEMCIIKVNNWTLGEMNISPYPEESCYRKVMDAFKKKYPASEARFYEYDVPYSIEGLKELK